jgi:hypothetical protein
LPFAASRKVTNNFEQLRKQTVITYTAASHKHSPLRGVPPLRLSVLMLRYLADY